MGIVDIRHSIFHESLQSHFPDQPQTPAAFELLVKHTVLVSGSLVLADSDLNNHPLMALVRANSITRGLFEDGVALGFIRRAARATANGSPISQGDLFADLSRNSAERAARVDPEVPAWTDRHFTRSEVHHPPLAWRPTSLASVFGARLRIELLRRPEELTSVGRSLVERVVEHVAGYQTNPEALKAARLEKAFFSQRITDPDQAQIWERVMASYTGNVPAAFDGGLIIASPLRAPASPIPGGPQASDAQQDLVADWYDAALSHQTSQRFVESQRPLYPHRVDPPLAIDPAGLEDLSLANLLELRMLAEPTRWLELRHEVLSCPNMQETMSRALYEAEQDYFERLGAALRRRGLFERKKQRHGQPFLRELAPRDVPGTCSVVASGGFSDGDIVSLLDTDAPDHEDAGLLDLSLKRPNYGVLWRVGGGSKPAT